MEVENKRTVNGWKIASRAVACAAVLALLLTMLFWPGETKTENGEIIAVPGVMKAYACDLDTTAEEHLKEFELPEDKYLARLIWTWAHNDHLLENSEGIGRPITFQIPEAYFENREVTFVLSSSCIGFCKETQLSNGEHIYLSRMLDRDMKTVIIEEVGEYKNIYLDVMIYADGKLAGYAVMTFVLYDEMCYLYKCTSVCFPPVDGQLQDVPKEYVLQKMEEYKQSLVEGEGTEYIRQVAEGKVA